MQEKYRYFTVELHDYTNEELVEIFQSTQKEAYLKELMVRNRGIIWNIASTYRIPAYDAEDLMEIGYIALWEATKNYDKARGYTFTSALKGFVRQQYNRLYNEAYREKRGGGEITASWDELEEINKERYSYDDHSDLYVADFLKALTGTAKQVAELLLDGVRVYLFSEGKDHNQLTLTDAREIYNMRKWIQSRGDRNDDFIELSCDEEAEHITEAVFREPVAMPKEPVRAKEPEDNEGYTDWDLEYSSLLRRR